MSKNHQRSNKEKKKPKQEASKPAETTASPLQIAIAKGVVTKGSSKKV